MVKIIPFEKPPNPKVWTHRDGFQNIEVAQYSANHLQKQLIGKGSHKTVKIYEESGGWFIVVVKDKKSAVKTPKPKTLLQKLWKKEGE